MKNRLKKYSQSFKEEKTHVTLKINYQDRKRKIENEDLQPQEQIMTACIFTISSYEGLGQASQSRC